ncbi:MAG: PIG-L family deacetylase [Anaerolineae bacterium]|nr:PIG-L family deacetylase [Anaerolineae bacterium]
MPQMVLALVPHPDDAEFAAGGTLARMAAEGARVVIVIATDGGAGSLRHDRDALAAIRAEEARRAAQILGAEEPLLLGHPDGGLDLLPAGLLREQFTRLIRRFRPDVLIAEDPWAPYEQHPDHRAVAWAASDAVGFSHLPLVYPAHRAEGLEPHFVAEKYWYGASPDAASHIVDISTTIDVKTAAIAAHESQVEFLVEDIARQAELAGLDLRARMGELAANPRQAIAWAVRQEAAATGQPAGLAFGEAFRCARFHPYVEALLAPQEG